MKMAVTRHEVQHVFKVELMTFKEKTQIQQMTRMNTNAARLEHEPRTRRGETAEPTFDSTIL